MKDLLSNAEVGDFIVRASGRVYQVSEFDTEAMMLIHITNNRQTPISFTNAVREIVDIYHACSVCNGDGDSRDADCPTCDNVGFLLE